MKGESKHKDPADVHIFVLILSSVKLWKSKRKRAGKTFHVLNYIRFLEHSEPLEKVASDFNAGFTLLGNAPLAIYLSLVLVK